MHTLAIMGLVAGGLAIPIGLFVSFAGSMSDAPALGDQYGRNGCIIAGGGLIAVIAGVLVLVLS